MEVKNVQESLNPFEIRSSLNIIQKPNAAIKFCVSLTESPEEIV